MIIFCALFNAYQSSTLAQTKPQTLMQHLLGFDLSTLCTNEATNNLHSTSVQVSTITIIPSQHLLSMIITTPSSLIDVNDPTFYIFLSLSLSALLFSLPISLSLTDCHHWHRHHCSLLSLLPLQQSTLNYSTPQRLITRTLVDSKPCLNY